jgi:hypothetical protein
MSLIPKLGTVVGVALVLASIGTTSLNAQTPVETRQPLLSPLRLQPMRQKL